jgi:hypothetical protein
MSARSRGRLFRKYLLVLLLLVGGLLTAAIAVELYVSYQESQRALVKVEQEKAFAAAATIGRFIQEIENSVRSTTRAIADDPSVAAPRRRDAAYRATLASALAEQRELDFLRLLRNVPAIVELRYIDVAGKEQIRVSRLALDAIGSGADFADAPAYKGARSGSVFFSPVYYRNDAEPFVTMAIPADPSAFEVITAEVSLRAMWDVVSGIKVGRNGFAYVVDAQGRLIAHPDIRQVSKGRDLAGLRRCGRRWPAARPRSPPPRSPRPAVWTAAKCSPRTRRSPPRVGSCSSSSRWPRRSRPCRRRSCAAR